MARRELPTSARVLGTAAGALTRQPNAAGESSLGDVVADALQTGSVAWGSTTGALIGIGELRGDFSRPTITYGVAERVLSRQQGATMVRLSGSAVHMALEQQFVGPTHRMVQISAGLRYTWDAAQPVGHRVDPTSITAGGAVLNPDGEYVFVVSDFLRSPAAHLPALATARPITRGNYGLGGSYAGTKLDLLAAYLSIRSPLPVPAATRITRIN